MRTVALGLISIAMTSGLLIGAEEQGSFDKSLTVTGAVDLDVKTDSGGIVVVTGSPGFVRIHAILRAQHGWFGSGDVAAHIRELEHNPPVQQDGNRVKIGYVQNRDLLTDVSMHLEIETPPDTRLQARVGSGGIRVAGIHGLADCRTDSGGIEVNDVGSGVHAVADSGGIHIHSAKGPVFAHADSGGIEATDVARDVDAQTDSGRIEISQTSPATIHAKADSGGVRVKLAAGAGYDINAESDSGHISVAEMTINSAFSRHHVEGKVRGGGPLVNVRVGSGGISIE
jgi:hypothetical protein